MIELQSVTKRFGRVVALDDVTLRVEQGHVHGFLGLNGAGKTTTIKLLMNFLRPTKGAVKLFGLDAHTHSTALKRRVGYLSGDFELYGNLTGDQYLRYIAHLRGTKDYDHLHTLCNELEAVLDRRIGTLSRGNKQKIGLVAALLDDPELLILDEPTTGLDPLMQQKFYEVVRKHAARGKTVFMSSHILSEIEEVCDVITVMQSGKVTKTINVADLRTQGARHISMKATSGIPLLKPSPRLGATNVVLTKHTLDFDVDVADKTLLRWIATQSVADVTITETNLETVFLDLYGERDV